MAMRKGACITLVIASAAMLGAGICTRGARADRGVDDHSRGLSIPQGRMALQRPQRGPEFVAQRPAAQRATDIIAVAAVARHPTGPDNAGQGRDAAQVRLASLEATPLRKMRSLSMESFEIPTDPALARADGQGQQGRSGAASVAQSAVAAKDASDAAQTVIRFDRVVININLPGFGS